MREPRKRQQEAAAARNYVAPVERSANIFDMPLDEFQGALGELRSQGISQDRIDDLMRQYRAQASPFAGINEAATASQGAIADAGRRPVAGGLLSKPEGATGMDAVRGLQFEGINGLLGALSGAGQAVDAPMAAARGLIPQGDMALEALGTAGAAMTGGGAAAGRGILDYDPNTINAGIPWRERVESSIPETWLNKKFEKPQWNPISSVSSALPESEMLPLHASTGSLVPESILRLEDFENSTAISALGDRSVAGVEIQGVGDKVYESPIRSLGGADFMRESGTGLWANDFKPARDLAKTASTVLEEGGDPIMVYTAMGPQSGDFSTMMMESVLNDFDPQRIDPATAQVFDDRIRNAAKINSWEGLLAPNLRERLADDMTGSQRWQLWQEMDKAAYRDAGLPDINMARRSITDPRLLNATPFDSGLTVGRMSGDLLSDPDVMHPTYNTQIGGDYLGGFDTIAGPILWRDFFENRRNSGASVGSDQRSFLMNSPRIAQKIDQQMIDEYYQMQEAIRGLNDPSSPLKLWTQSQ